MAMKQAKAKFIEIVKDLAPNYGKLIRALFWIQVSFTIMFFLLLSINIFLVLFIAITAIVLYVVCKDLFKESDIDGHFKKTTHVLMASFVNLPLTAMGLFFRAVLKDSDTPLNYPTMFGMSMFCILITFMFTLTFLRNERIKEYFEIIKKESILAMLHISLLDNLANDGDIKLCNDEKTGRAVILPKKDRYLHMLILGPTGSGKTSQIILPMINQDIQNLSAGITVLEPKGDLAEKAYAMAQSYGRPALYFNPILDSCPTFNPLYGKEEDVIENLTTTFKMLNPDSPQFFLDMNETLIRNALKVLKRTKGNRANMLDLFRLVTDSGGQGKAMVMALQKIAGAAPETAKENADLASYFLSDYFSAGKTKTYEHCSGVRSQISKIVSNKFLRKVLNPDDGKSGVDWDKHLEEGTVLCITTAQGNLRDLGRFLGYFLMLSFQSSVFKRPGNENTRRDHFLYIDEFQTYSNPGFADMLTQGRSYRVASHLATQNRALIGMGSGRDGEDFIELVSTNARNVVIFPGGNFKDAKYYSEQFGEVLERKVQNGMSTTQFNPLYGFQQIKYPTKTSREMEEYVARYSPTDIIYKKFGEITYAIIQNNTLQVPSTGKISYIPRELNEKLDRMIPENHNLMLVGLDPNECRDLQNGGELKDHINMYEINERAKAISGGTVLTMAQRKDMGEDKMEDLSEIPSVDVSSEFSVVLPPQSIPETDPDAGIIQMDSDAIGVSPPPSGGSVVSDIFEEDDML